MARANSTWSSWTLTMVAFGLMATTVMGGQILKTSGFSDCGSDSTVKVDRINISYNNENKTVNFDVAGSSSKQQNVTAILDVTAYGNTVYSKSFNPCDKATFVERLCPVPVGQFAAQGTQQIPSQFANMVPGIAFEVPDISAHATLRLVSQNGDKVACVQSDVSNGKTTDIPAVSYVAVGVACAALVMSGVSAAGAALSGGSAALGGGTAGPSFGETIGWFQGMAMNSMLSVNYPPIYRNFAKNFAFSAGIIPWSGMQNTIDNFRSKTGGNLTQDSFSYLQTATLVFPDGSTRSPNQGLLNFKRAVDVFVDLAERAVETSVNSTDPVSSGDSNGVQHKVKGIQAFAEQLLVPKSNIFMTALLIVAIIIAAIAVGILLVKVILEAWALFGNFPEGLKGFRKHYWGSIARTITSLILLLYGIWVLYCVFQFTNGDNTVAKILAAVTLAIFTAILAFFSWKIWSVAHKLKTQDGDTAAMFENKKIWVKYSLFYDSYKRQYWWLFVPAILYMFAKGVAIAAGDGHGVAQTIAQLIIEAIMLCLLLWSRPFERRSGNVINIVIQVVRVLSIACILVFVEEFGIKQTTQTIAGVVLIAVQATLTGVLAILITWNGINACCKINPHRKRRKEAEKLKRDMDNLTPLDARNSLLLDRAPLPQKSMFSVSGDLNEKGHVRNGSAERFHPGGSDMRRPVAPSGGHMYRPLTPTLANDSQGLLDGAAPISVSDRQPTLPTIDREYRGSYGPSARYGNGGYNRRF
ncbi:Transient receptor potential (TRP) domain containing protein [Metarhizium album ARSEF 1941]|uniref:Transient receptor potential (TRP) domain containing protein n=1 Tax=Metarhizium album (strain ARSEF 1941) TaxID=1081103 RepID=A0A0B2X2I1_METAS|nr:Transient receptor potential (TRP) domain containing protein [Metarhizium album ARSEF 1941]KHN99947.1 Transient receptor potential (TRP) domain containing protein [Metarhizium album ARSEF 1941]